MAEVDAGALGLVVGVLGEQAPALEHQAPSSLQHRPGTAGGTEVPALAWRRTTVVQGQPGHPAPRSCKVLSPSCSVESPQSHPLQQTAAKVVHETWKA